MKSKKKLVKKSGRVLEALMFSFVTVLSLDLLYLYSAGGWQEPNTVIRRVELALLPTLAILGVIMTVAKLKEFARLEKK